MKFLKERVKIFYGILVRPQETLVALSDEHYYFWAPFVFLAKEIIDFFYYLSLGVPGLARRIGDSALVFKLAESGPDKLAEVERKLQALLVREYAYIWLGYVVLFLVLSVLGKLILSAFDRHISYVKAFNILGSSFLPRFYFLVILYLVLARFGWSELALVKILSSLIMFYCYALFLTGIFLNSEKK